MTTDLNDKAAVEAKLWEEIEASRFGMLAVLATPQDHFQPMTAFAEPESGTLWFFTSRDSDLARSAAGGGKAMFVFLSRDRELQASIRGELTAHLDDLHRDKYWSSVVSAWFPKGKSDPNLTMLKFVCSEAQVWISEAGGIKFGWEIARANVTGSRPDVGGWATVKLG
jgi:general stress protein 26